MNAHHQDDCLIRSFEQGDHDQWQLLWDQNNQGYRDDAVTARTWQRLMTADSPVHGIGAYKNGVMAGFLHYILHPVTGHIAPVCYMQDLFIMPDNRRQGLAKGLIHALAATGRTEKWARIYWLAEQDNESAQALYRHIGKKLAFSLHVMSL